MWLARNYFFRVNFTSEIFSSVQLEARIVQVFTIRPLNKNYFRRPVLEVKVELETSFHSTLAKDLVPFRTLGYFSTSLSDAKV